MINVVCGIRSTGRICTDIADALTAQGHEVKIAYGRETVPEKYQKYAVRIGSDFGVKLHGLRARLTDGAGFGSKADTKKFIEWVKEFDPDVIHLHNIHGYYINIEVLFDYLRTCGKKVIWTLHDCWAFTGHCTYFSYVQCDKWKYGCCDCLQTKDYPQSMIDMSKENWERKRRLFSDIPNMTLVTPSKWLHDLVKDSFLRDYPSLVINNGIDTTIFQPSLSDLREKYNLGDKRIVLGVAAIWNSRKGLNYIEKLSDMLNDYKFVIVGLTPKQKDDLAKSMVGICRTNSAKELAEWYSIASVYINPTLEDNYPTTNLEAIACGTPVITFDTGGSPESAAYYGATVAQEDVEAMGELIKEMNFKKTDFDVSIERMLRKYTELYE